MRRFLLLLTLGIAGLAAVDAAQSLADVARQEEARRKAIKNPGKVYTNADLKPDPTRTAVPGPSAAVDPQPPADATAADQVPPLTLPGGSVEEVSGDEDEEKGELYWRQRIGTARAVLDRSRVLADALQSRLNALATDIVNRDDPAQRSQLELERQRALAELERTQKDIAAQQATISEIEEEARKAGVPAGWLR
jgi:hypothetical protein